MYPSLINLSLNCSVVLLVLKVQRQHTYKRKNYEINLVVFSYIIKSLI